MSDAGSATPAWYPDPYGRHEYRWFDGRTWTEQVSDHGRQGVDPPAGAVVPDVRRDAGRIERDLARAGAAAGAAWAGSGHLFDEPVLVVSQKAKLIEVNNEYGVFDRSGNRLGVVRQVG
jgi:hypothetical protein